MSSPKSPGEARKQNGSRKRKRPSPQDSETDGIVKSKVGRVVRVNCATESYFSMHIIFHAPRQMEEMGFPV